MMDDILGPWILDEPLRITGNRIAHPDKVVVICDHYVPPANVNQANIVAYTRKWAEKHHITNYFEGQGPCHQVLAENCFSLPGTLQVGTDSHTCTGGAFGCFGTGIGSTEMAGVLAEGKIWLKVPESIRINWEGVLPRGVMAKDIILKTIGDIGHAGATYMSMEFTGGTIRALSMDERMCISNMTIEAGAKCGLIAADDKTEEYLRKHGYSGDINFIDSDPDATYVKILEYKAENLVPQVACPHNVDNVKPVTEVKGVRMDVAYLGSCTGGRLNDLKVASSILKNKKTAKSCRLLVSPASWKVWLEADEQGILACLVEAGATILAPTCGACLGVHSGVLAAGENCVSATNRNFKGRMGSCDASVYLASPATVAASAVEGRIADPREY